VILAVPSFDFCSLCLPACFISLIPCLLRFAPHAHVYFVLILRPHILKAHIPYRSRPTDVTHTHCWFLFSYPLIMRPASPACVIYIYIWSSKYRRAYRMQRQCNDRLALSHYDSSPAECAAARCVHSIAFALTASAPCSSPILFSSASHFLKKTLKMVRNGDPLRSGK
jgi:hypothetical protein